MLVVSDVIYSSIYLFISAPESSNNFTAHSLLWTMKSVTHILRGVSPSKFAKFMSAPKRKEQRKYRRIELIDKDSNHREILG